HPLCGKVPVFPASFVDPDMASGIVMSVPAHAPFDYIALRDLQEKGQAAGITMVNLLTVEGYGTFPAKDAVERAGIRDQNDPRLESVTQEVYSAEFARGRMLPQFGGKSVREARDQVTAEMQEKYGSVPMFDFDTRPVVCRCGGRVTVRILHDQWFLHYSNPEWKAEIHDQLGKMALVPPETRAEFSRTVDWLKDWACTRRVGLGTRLPWDREWIVEPLSDSTIYMAYYTIAHHMKAIPPENLTPEVFDYLFLGKGNPTTVPKETLDGIRKEFLYWYPYDFRFSAKDLISNHLTFQLFHHRAIFPPEFQPRGMVVFGMGLLNGAKMSSSKGNVVLLSDAIDEFGADTVRMFLVGSAEPWQDFDWRNEMVASTRRQIERFWNLVHEAMEGGGGKTKGIDAWLASRLQGRIARATEALRNFQTRQALQESWFGIEADLKWYRRRSPDGILKGDAVRDLCSAWIRLLAPFIPYTCEDLWAATGGKGPVGFAPWPVPDEKKVDRKSEIAEELLIRTVEDVESIRKLLPMTPKAAVLITAPEWKWDVFRTIAGAAEKKDATRLVMQDPGMRKRGKAAADAVKQVTALIHRFPPELVRDLLADRVDESTIFTAALPFLEKEFGVPVKIIPAEEATHAKAASALPFKPAIVLE
ncbi:MAG: leucine--tRNA ligase, partial [Methanomicrobiales archaeon]|nr:leucine--tRNA ligase [Methanomicrobiales archaeon]